MKINNVTSNNCTTKSNKNVSFSGLNYANFAQKCKTVAKDLFEPQRSGGMSQNLFTLNAFVFLLGGRLVKSRDGNEKRETLTRDIPTILLAVYALPLLAKRIASGIQTKTGFAILNDSKDFSKGLIDCEKVSDWYTFDKNLKTGFKGFVDRLVDRGANVKKVVSQLSLSKKMKEIVKNSSDDNAKFIDELFKNEALNKQVQTKFAKEGNGAFKQASFVKNSSKLAGLVITLGLIGIFIPNLNILITELVNRGKGVKKGANDEKAPASKESAPPESVVAASVTAPSVSANSIESFLGKKQA